MTFKLYEFNLYRMTDKRKNWLCPFCPHRASRKGNMKVHIQRWHGGREQPLLIGDQTETQLKSCLRPSSTVNNPASAELPPSPNLKSSKRPESVFEFINKIHSQVIEVREMRRKIEEINSFYNGGLSWFPQLNISNSLANFAITDFGKLPVPRILLPPFSADKLSPPSTIAPAFNSQETMKEEVAGFTAKICDNCTEIVIETHYGVHRSGKDPTVITKNSHMCCHPTKTLTLENLAVRIINISAKLTELPSELKKAVKSWTGQDTYLVAFRLPIDKVKADIIDIYTSSIIRTDNNRSSLDFCANQYNKVTRRWMLLAIENGQTILDDDDFTDFIRVANNKTSGFFRIHPDRQEKVNIDNSSSYPGIYCMFINKGPLLNK
jgi:hypothetical protein